MQQHELRPPKGATHKRKRIGRGNASGHGTYSTRGLKGQNSRSGGGVRPGFEGGQLPLIRRMAYKRGFRNPNRVEYEEINVGALSRFAAGSEVGREQLAAVRLARTKLPVKILGTGDLSVALTVEADAFSKSAQEKIEKAGGTVRRLRPVAEAAAPAKEQAAPAAQPEPEAQPEEKPKARAPRKTAAKKAAKEKEPTGPEAQEEETDGAGS